MNMTSRERIIEALNHREPDKLPIDFGAMRSTGISIYAYDKLRKELGLTKGLPKLYDLYQMLAEPEMAVVDRLGGDVVQSHRMRPSFGISIENWKEAELKNGVRCLVPEGYNPRKNPDGSQDVLENGKIVAHMPESGLYYDTVGAPMGHIETLEDVEKVQFPRLSEHELDFIEAECKALHDNTDKAVLFAFGGNILEAGEAFIGFEYFFELLLTEPELVHAWLTKLTDSYMDDLAALLPRIAPYVNIIQFGDDLGMQNAPLISTATYREMIMPYHAKQYDFVHKNHPDLKVFLHSCGAIAPLIPHLIEAGVDILNPIQISADGMDPRMLKREFGKHLTFWGGGANMQVTVQNGNIPEIKSEVKELIEIFSPGGGYVFNQVHNIQANVTPERILAIYDTALSNRNCY